MIYVKSSKEGYAQFYAYEPEQPYFTINETDMPKRPDDVWGKDIILFADITQKALWWEYRSILELSEIGDSLTGDEVEFVRGMIDGTGGIT